VEHLPFRGFFNLFWEVFPTLNTIGVVFSAVFDCILDIIGYYLVDWLHSGSFHIVWLVVHCIGFFNLFWEVFPTLNIGVVFSAVFDCILDIIGYYLVDWLHLGNFHIVWLVVVHCIVSATGTHHIHILTITILYYNTQQHKLTTSFDLRVKSCTNFLTIFFSLIY